MNNTLFSCGFHFVPRKRHIPATEVCNLPVEFPAAVFWSASTFRGPSHICQNVIPTLAKHRQIFSSFDPYSPDRQFTLLRKKIAGSDFHIRRIINL